MVATLFLNRWPSSWIARFRSASSSPRDFSRLRQQSETSRTSFRRLISSVSVSSCLQNCRILKHATDLLHADLLINQQGDCIASVPGGFSLTRLSWTIVLSYISPKDTVPKDDHQKGTINWRPKCAACGRFLVKSHHAPPTLDTTLIIHACNWVTSGRVRAGADCLHEGFSFYPLLATKILGMRGYAVIVTLVLAGRCCTLGR